MADNNEPEQIQTHLQSLTEALQSGTAFKVRLMLNSLHPAEIARLLESMPPAQRDVMWELVDPENDGEVLLHVGDEVRARLIRSMDADELVAAAGGMDMDDLADILQDLPDVVIHEILESMNKQDRHRLESVLSYPEDSAGGLMNIDTITVRADTTLEVVLRYLRMHTELPELTDSLIVVNRFDHYLGLLPLTTLLTRDPGATVAEVMVTDIEPILATTSARDVASLFEDRNLVSAPVTDEHKRLLGRITVDDVVDVIRDEGEHSLMSMAGLTEEEDMFAPVLPSSKRRGVWLGVNLLTALLASWVIAQFQDVLEKFVALAVLMPIVASMGGIAGSQTLTLMIRSMALGQVGGTNIRWLMRRELLVGAVNGLFWSMVVAAVTVYWFDDYSIGGIIAAALILNLICAALAGFSIPLILKRMGIDPALAGTVILTTITDVIGFFAFLGLGTLLLLK